jgi:hypothetical protein
MRDLVAREALRTMAGDAAKRFRELVANGSEIPYDVREPGSGSPLPQYVPLTERFIRRHAPALSQLDSYGSACAAIESADLAGPYLEELGVEVPADARKRAELAGVAFLCRLWEGSTDFSLDAERLRSAIAELEAGGEVADDEIEVVVPLRGLRMPLQRLELATATIARADTVDVPGEARTSEGAGAAGWEPTYLAATRIGIADSSGGDPERKPDAGARAVEAFRQLITTLRLFKGGGVALGPYAWTRAGADRWRRIATGAGRPRPGGYRIAEEELGDLAVFSRALAYRSNPFGRPTGDGAGLSSGFGRAISRFEAGLERSLVLEALNDHLLALRFLLEGGGPADLGLAMRVAALCAEPEQRGETKAVVDRALALERELWSGEPASAADDVLSAAETAAAIEDLLRAILRDAACGHLGSDLRSTADEILLADGLAIGEGADGDRGGAEEWDLPPDDPDATELIEDDEPEELPAEDLPVPEDDPSPEEPPIEDPVEEAPSPVEAPEPTPGAAVQGELWMDDPDTWSHAIAGRRGNGSVQVPEPGGRIKVESRPTDEEENVFANRHDSDEGPPTSRMDTAEAPHSRLAELLEARPRQRERTADRVAYLFPRPETTEWNVSELSYDRRRRARTRGELQAS